MYGYVYGQDSDLSLKPLSESSFGSLFFTKLSLWSNLYFFICKMGLLMGLGLAVRVMLFDWIPETLSMNLWVADSVVNTNHL